MCRWMLSHQDIARARDEWERVDIKMTDLEDGLAKKGTQLLVPQGKGIICFFRCEIFFLACAKI